MRERELKQHLDVGGLAKCRSLPMRERELKHLTAQPAAG